MKHYNKETFVINSDEVMTNNWKGTKKLLWDTCSWSIDPDIWEEFMNEEDDEKFEEYLNFLENELQEGDVVRVVMKGSVKKVRLWEEERTGFNDRVFRLELLN